jgi:hypothetical protein
MTMVMACAPAGMKGGFTSCSTVIADWLSGMEGPPR